MAKTKRMMKQTVLFVVEGFSDRDALKKIFKKIYKNRNIEFCFTRGDITSDCSVTVSNVEDRLNTVIKEFLNYSKMKRGDILQIVHLFDTDGAYVPDSAAVAGGTGSFFYTTTSISCKDPSKIIKRNKHKRAILDYLQKLSKIGGIAYAAYYMSCNLDHVLYNEQNLGIDRKISYADSFYDLFRGKEEKFIDFLKTEAVNGVPDTSLKATWEYIRQGLHSLERHTNLHYYFIDHPPYAL